MKKTCNKLNIQHPLSSRCFLQFHSHPAPIYKAIHLVKNMTITSRSSSSFHTYTKKKSQSLQNCFPHTFLLKIKRVPESQLPVLSHILKSKKLTSTILPFANESPSEFSSCITGTHHLTSRQNNQAALSIPARQVLPYFYRN